jgi:hypothetical protein
VIARDLFEAGASSRSTRRLAERGHSEVYSKLSLSVEHAKRLHLYEQ